MIINYIKPGQQVCKQAHTCKTVLHTCYCTTFIQGSDQFFVTLYSPNQCQTVERAPHLAINSFSVSRPPHVMLLCTVAQRIMSTTRLYSYIAGRLILILGRIFTGISQTIRYRPSLQRRQAKRGVFVGGSRNMIGNHWTKSCGVNQSCSWRSSVLQSLVPTNTHTCLESVVILKTLTDLLRCV